MKIRAFTLIEVLIALTILSIALTAVMQAVSSNTNDMIHIQNSTIANLVATRYINELQAGALPPSATSGTTKALGIHWSYQVNLQSTPNVNIKRIVATVAQEKHPSDTLAHLVSFLDLSTLSQDPAA